MDVRVVLIAAALVACGAPVDPLAETRTAWQAEPPADDWAPQVVLAVDREALGSALLRAVELPETVALHGPMGLPLVVRPRVNGVTLTLDGERCLSCLDLTTRVDAVVSVQVPPFVNLSGLPVRVDVSAALKSWTENGALMVAWDEAVPITATAAFEHLPRQAAALADGILTGWVVTHAQGLIPEPMALLRLPNVGPATPTAARLTADEHLRVEFALPSDSTPPAVGPLTIPDGSDWTLAVHTEAILETARVVALTQPPDARYLFEPLAVTVGEDSLEVDMRWHRRSRNGRWRDLVVQAALEETLDGSHIAVIESVTAQGHEHWPGRVPTHTLHRRMQAVLDRAGVRLPSRRTIDPLASIATWSSWTPSDDLLRVDGRLTPLQGDPD